MGQELEEEFVDPTTPPEVLRGSILLAALTENEGLPADPDYRIQVSWLIHHRHLGSHVTHPSSAGITFPGFQYLLWGFIRAAGPSTSFSRKTFALLAVTTSTVRCLATVKPEWVEATGEDGVIRRERWPKRPMIVAGR